MAIFHSFLISCDFFRREREVRHLCFDKRLASLGMTGGRTERVSCCLLKFRAGFVTPSHRESPVFKDPTQTWTRRLLLRASLGLLKYLRYSNLGLVEVERNYWIRFWRTRWTITLGTGKKKNDSINYLFVVFHSFFFFF